MAEFKILDHLDKLDLTVARTIHTAITVTNALLVVPIISRCTTALGSIRDSTVNAPIGRSVMRSSHLGNPAVKSNKKQSARSRFGIGTTSQKKP